MRWTIDPMGRAKIIFRFVWHENGMNKNFNCSQSPLKSTHTEKINSYRIMEIVATDGREPRRYGVF